MKNKLAHKGFTLIELSIVLVIIGLIVGGVLVGRDLVAAAKIRAQISQIEQFNTAVRTFQNKYNCLPGDCKNASAFGFAARTGTPFHGDNDGFIEDCDGGPLQLGCETSLFWHDLGDAKLISGAYSGDIDNPVSVSSGAIMQYLPAAKIDGLVVMVQTDQRFNFFLLDYINSTDGSGLYVPVYTGGTRAKGVTALQAFQMDSKPDDGLPLTRHVLASTEGTVNAILGCNYVGSWSSPYSSYPVASQANTPSCALVFQMM